jgi:5-methylcytosine-specific restriction enzyme B
MKHVSKERLVLALRNLASFRESVNKQGAQHILPFLALKRAGANAKAYTVYNEAKDFEFFDEFCHVRSGEFPYFDPIASAFRITSHPHSNVATARKGTFARSWHAGDYRSTAEGDEWILNGKYIDILRDNVLTKKDRVTLTPTLDLIAFLYRRIGFPGRTTPKDLLQRFKTDFRLSSAEFGSLFDGTIREGESNFFSDHALSDSDVLSAIDESGVVRDLRPDRPYPSESTIQPPTVTGDDPIVLQARRLLFEDGYAGVVLVGPPGTSKSWYALQIASHLTDGAEERIFKIQFHRSYQYENFVEGYVPKLDGSGFELRDQLALVVAQQADENPELRYVIVIDELSRSDPGRVFGELLTYMEPTRRGESFLLPSGRETMLPANVYFVASMNSRDKAVLEIDDAFDRRLAKIPMNPEPKTLEQFLVANRMEQSLGVRVLAFFKWVNEAYYPLGHTFFLTARDQDSLRQIWDNQLSFVFQKAFPYEPATVEEIKQKYTAILLQPAEQPQP